VVPAIATAITTAIAATIAVPATVAIPPFGDGRINETDRGACDGSDGQDQSEGGC
jgi:hypothetical protein